MPEVSVVIPAYNYGHYVGFAVQSVLSQTFTDLEVIVVDDGSTDNTRQVIQGIVDPRLQYIYQDNQGLSAARNAGINAASGDHIGFLDADDLWLPDKLMKQVPLLRQDSEIGLVYGSYQLIDEHDQVIAVREAACIPGSPLPALLKSNIVAGSSTTSLVRRSCFARAGVFDKELSGAADWDMWLRIGRYYKFSCVSEPVAAIRFHEGSMSRDPEHMSSDTLRVIEKFFSDTSLPPEIEAWKNKAKSGVHLTSANFYRREAQYNQAIRHICHAIRFDPLWILPYHFLVQVFIQAILKRK